MNKQSQSLLDFINVVPLQSLVLLGRSPVSNKEATTLYNLWRESERDLNGNIIAPLSSDPTTIASLTTKGMLKSKLNGYTISDNRLLEITKKGKEIIKNIILHTERSVFDKSASGMIDYESVDRLINKPILTASKIVSKQQEPQNWFQRAIWRSY